MVSEKLKSSCPAFLSNVNCNSVGGMTSPVNPLTASTDVSKFAFPATSCTPPAAICAKVVVSEVANESKALIRFRSWLDKITVTNVLLSVGPIPPLKVTLPMGAVVLFCSVMEVRVTEGALMTELNVNVRAPVLMFKLNPVKVGGDEALV